MPPERARRSVNAYIRGGIDGELLLRVPELRLCVPARINVLRRVLLLRRVAGREIRM